MAVAVRVASCLMSVLIGGTLRGHPEEAVALCDLLRVGRREEVLAAAADLTAALRAISGLAASQRTPL